MPFSDAVKMLEKAYVYAAECKIQKDYPDEKVTYTRLAYLTGIDTRSIRRIRAQTIVNFENSPELPESRLLGAWTKIDPFCAPGKKAKTLPLVGKGSFQSLINVVFGRNVTYTTLLDHLIKSGNIKMQDENNVKLVKVFYEPKETNRIERVVVGLHATENLIRTIAHNLDAGTRMRFVQQQRWVNKGDDADDIKQLRSATQKRIKRHLLGIEKAMEPFEHENESKQKGSINLGIGYYYYEEKITPP